MENRDGKHIWENEGWEAMEKLLDKDMPVSNSIWASRTTKFAVIALCLLSFGFWLLPTPMDWNRERGGGEKPMTAASDVSNYTLSSVSELSEVDVNSNFGELSSAVSARGYDSGFGVRYGAPIEFRHLTFESFSDVGMGEMKRRKGATFIPHD
ncbi:MAG: hypothetical protein GVX96_04035, partial [Bacteroidetes bacterium]|nr:hypothetical protein [Bacteroidota bacterium]